MNPLVKNQGKQQIMGVSVTSIQYGKTNWQLQINKVWNDHFFGEPDQIADRCQKYEPDPIVDRFRSFPNVFPFNFDHIYNCF